MKHQTGQDERAFAEVVKLAASELDIAALTLQDDLRLVTLTGCKEFTLERKNVRVRRATMATFNSLIDSHMHSKSYSCQS